MTEENVIETEETETDTVEQDIRDAFDTAIDSGNDDSDDVKLAMITAGASFKNVTRYYNSFMENAGLTLSKEKKTEIAAEAVSENDVSTQEGFDTAVKSIVDASSGKVTERSAAGLVRAQAKAEKIEFYKKPKGTGKPRSTFMDDMYEMMFQNPNITEAELETYIKENGNKTNISIMQFHQRTRAMVNRMAKAKGL